LFLRQCGLGCKLAADRGTGGKTPEKGKIAVKTRLDFTDSGSLRAKSIVGTGGTSFAMFAIDYAIKNRRTVSAPSARRNIIALQSKRRILA
jgi:hypothetical protein